MELGDMLFKASSNVYQERIGNKKLTESTF